jgi:hypothetical protein
VSNDTVGKYLLKLQEMTQHSDRLIDMYKIGENIGLLDKIQTDHIVEILSKDGYIRNYENSKVELTEEGLERLAR